MNKHYQSIYGTHIRQFIEMKQKLGFKYNGASVILAQIDKLATELEINSSGITQAFAANWSQLRLGESEYSRYGRISILAQFSSFLCDLGIETYLPKRPPMPVCNFIPYIYTPQEIEAIFKAADELRLQISFKSSSLIAVPAIIRLLYSTGLRIGEALALKDEDINLEQQYLRVLDSKNAKERIIPIDLSLVAVCQQYKSYRDQLPGKENQSPYFFTNGNRPPSGNSVRDWFRKCLELAAITGKSTQPRLHDLRHTFAVRALANMAEAGMDLYVSLPILSTYLGHQSLRATDHYVRLTKSIYPDLIDKLDIFYLDVFPQFRNYDTH